MMREKEMMGHEDSNVLSSGALKRVQRGNLDLEAPAPTLMPAISSE